MAEPEKRAVISYIYVNLRRKLKRTIDVEWALQNQPYAEEVIRLCRGARLDDLEHYAGRLEAMISRHEDASPAPRYIGALR